ncbi:MAG TPA: hypothetical protein VGH28_06385 [Polyangiaceae bacterium]
MKLRALFFLVVVLAASCGPAGFDAISKIEGVRVLAASADEPYAKPGDTVTLTLDAVDGRPSGSPGSMTIYWLPFQCEDPASDLYYACFANFISAGTGDAGAPTGGAFPPNLDVTDLLPQGPKMTFTMPSDVIAKHPVVAGSTSPYGVVFWFAMACAGRVRTLPIDPSAGNGQSVPLGCFDDQGNQLGPDSYVFTYMRVYAYDDVTNANPEIDGVTFDGQTIDAAQGVVVPHCDPNVAGSCDTHAINLTVPDSAWEIATGVPLEPDGTQLHEEIWADYYETLGDLDSDGKLLFDTRTGRVPGSDNAWAAPSAPGQGHIYIVVHDNRNGASWVDFPVFVK